MPMHHSSLCFCSCYISIGNVALNSSMRIERQRKALLNFLRGAPSIPLPRMLQGELDGYLAYTMAADGQSMYKLVCYRSKTSLVPFRRPKWMKDLVDHGKSQSRAPETSLQSWFRTIESMRNDSCRSKQGCRHSA